LGSVPVVERRIGVCEAVSRIHFRRPGGSQARKSDTPCGKRASFEHKALKSYAFQRYQIRQNWLIPRISEAFTMLSGE
jgi:hypothetical protein